MERTIFNLAFYLFFVSQPSWSVVGCPGSIHQDALSRLKEVEKASIVGPVDNRMTYETYATKYGQSLSKVYSKFSAAGRMYCGDAMGSGQVTVSANVVTASAHNFYDDNCKPRVSDFTKCFFLGVSEPSTVPVKYFVKSVEVGTTCPRDDPYIFDWAVVKLERVVEGVRPLKIDSNCVLAPGLNGLHLAATHNNFGDQRNPPRTVGYCQVMEAVNAIYRTNCSAGGGASGSAITCEKRDSLFLSGLMVAAQTNPAADYKPYSHQNSNIVIPVNGNFLKAIEVAVLAK